MARRPTRDPDDFPAPRSVGLRADMDSLDPATLARRLERRRPGIFSVADGETARLVASIFPDPIVRAGCIEQGKIRPNSLYVLVYMMRILTRQDLSIRELAAGLGVPYRRARMSIERGTLLVEVAKKDGRLDQVLRPEPDEGT